MGLFRYARNLPTSREYPAMSFSSNIDYVSDLWLSIKQCLRLISASNYQKHTNIIPSTNCISVFDHQFFTAVLSDKNISKAPPSEQGTFPKHLYRALNKFHETINNTADDSMCLAETLLMKNNIALFSSDL